MTSTAFNTNISMDSEKGNTMATINAPQAPEGCSVASTSSIDREEARNPMESSEGDSESGSSDLTRSEQQTERTTLFQKMKKKGLCAFLFVAFVAFLIVDSIYFCILPDALSGFLEWIEENPVPGIFSFTLVFFVATIILIPGALLTLGAGYVFANAFGMGLGVALGTLSTFVGACAGSLASFLLGRYLMRDWVDKLSHKYEICKALNAAMNEKGFRIMVLLRLSPVIPFNVINYIAGVTGITLLEYTISLLALLPGTVLYVFLGASAGSLADSAHSGRENSTVTTVVIVVSVVLGIFAIGLTSFYAKKELNKIAENKQSRVQHHESVTETLHMDELSGLENVSSLEEGVKEEETAQEVEPSRSAQV